MSTDLASPPDDARPRPARFLFDQDFGAPTTQKPAAAPQAAAAVSLEDHEAALKKAETSAFRRGEAEGRKAARNAETARLSAAVESLGARLAEALAQADVRAVTAEREGVALALALARKIAGAAVARAPMAEIEAAAEACFLELRQAPHVAVRVSPEAVEPVRETLASMAHERGFAGRLIVLGDPEVAKGDVRLEWADGGVVRDSGAVGRAIDDAIAQHFAAEGGADDTEGATP